MARRSNNPFAGLIIGLIFTPIGVALIIFWGWPVLSKAKESVNWPVVTGSVTRSEVAQKRDSDGDRTYRPDVEYKYSVDEEDFVGFDVYVASSSMWSSSRSSANETVRKYKVGKDVEVHYNPNDPADAVLEPGTNWMTYLPFGIGLIFAVIGGLILVGSLSWLLFAGAAIGAAAVGVMSSNNTSEDSGRSDFPPPQDDWDTSNPPSNYDDKDDGFGV